MAGNEVEKGWENEENEEMPEDEVLEEDTDGSKILTDDSRVDTPIGETLTEHDVSNHEARIDEPINDESESTDVSADGGPMTKDATTEKVTIGDFLAAVDLVADSAVNASEHQDR